MEQIPFMIDEIPIMIEMYADEFIGLMFLIIDLGIQLIMALIDRTYFINSKTN